MLTAALCGWQPVPGAQAGLPGAGAPAGAGGGSAPPLVGPQSAPPHPLGPPGAAYRPAARTPLQVCAEAAAAHPPQGLPHARGRRLSSHLRRCDSNVFLWLCERIGSWGLVNYTYTMDYCHFNFRNEITKHKPNI